MEIFAAAEEEMLESAPDEADCFHFGWGVDTGGTASDVFSINLLVASSHIAKTKAMLEQGG